MFPGPFPPRRSRVLPGATFGRQGIELPIRRLADIREFLSVEEECPVVTLADFDEADHWNLKKELVTSIVAGLGESSDEDTQGVAGRLIGELTQHKAYCMGLLGDRDRGYPFKPYQHHYG